LSNPIYGQLNCSELLIKANIAFNQGKYEEVLALLQPKIDLCNFNKVERDHATKILASALLKVDEVEEAEKYVYLLLKKNPTYEIQPSVDPQPFVTVLNRFERSPQSVIGFYLGSYIPFVSTQKKFMVWEAADYSSKYKTESNLSFSLYFQYFITKKLSIELEPEITKLKFSREINATDMASISYNENATRVKIPFSFGYKIYTKNKFATSLSAGIYGSSTWGYQYNLSYKLPDSGLNEYAGELDIQRNSKNIGYQFGLKTTYTNNRLRYSVKFDYAADLKLYNNSSNRYGSNNFLLDYNYVDDDFKISNLGIKLGVAYTFSYKIKHKYR
jgi:hypothetical protein